MDIRINTLLSQAKGFYLRGRPETQIITISGFSWDKAPGGKPLKLTAFAFKDKKLFVCVASSSKAFTVSKELDSLRFVKTTGGQKRRTSAPKTIEYALGMFHTEVEGDIPLFLPLHFGKSYARRYLFNKRWGLFSDNPKMFLNNARLKRQKVNPGDPWTYYFDVSISAERVFGYKDFTTDILTNAECVIGIDRGEVKPIAYSVIRLRDGEILEHGFLASTYIMKLMEYDNLKRNYQRKRQIFPKYLRLKIVRLQDTLLETAASDILTLVGKYRGVVVLENLNSHFRGAELSIIPKKTYKKVETLVADALQLAGLLRIDTHGSYWGGLRTVFPGGTSQTCIRCGQVWNKDFKDRIVQQSSALGYSNIDFTRGILEFEGKRITLNHAYKVFNPAIKHTEKKGLPDLQASILAGNALLSARYLRLAMGPRLTQETFICALCGYTENADIVGAINIAKRGAEQIQKLLQK